MDEALQLRASFENAPTPFCWNATPLTPRGKPPSDCGTLESSAGLCYPSCPSGFEGCGSVCLQTCPDGSTDLGFGCKKAEHGPGSFIVKQSQFRKPAGAPTCAGGVVPKGGLCYEPCPPGSEDTGLFCWVGCPEAFPVSCGFGCAVSADACTQTLADQIRSSGQISANIAAALAAKGDFPVAVPLTLSPEHVAALSKVIEGILRKAAPELSDAAVAQLTDALLDAAQTGSIELGDFDPESLKAMFGAFLFPICSDEVLPAEG